MSIEAAFVLPHPPLAIPEIGRGQERAISDTISGYRRAARSIADLRPDTIIVASPHSVMYSDYIHISGGDDAAGDMSGFGQPQVRLSKSYDTQLVSRICDLASERGVSAGTLGERDPSLDHGTMVPLMFVEEEYSDYMLVRCGLSGLPLIEHYRLGQCIAEAVESLGRRAVMIASGDLSHRLLEDGPYGFDPDAPVYEERVVRDIAAGDFGDLLEFDEALCSNAAECGHRSFVIMAGVLDGRSASVELMSHEGPFGVGYATAIVTPGAPDDSRRFGEAYLDAERDSVAQAAMAHDAHLQLARMSVEAFVLRSERLTSRDPKVTSMISTYPDASEELLSSRAGAFVSIHEHDSLRGCIGTISPTCETLADEILQNAVSACSSDPRFSPVTADELPYLDISVDVLKEPEPIDSTDQLDPERYGVIVSSGSRKGLLLPALEGVDTVEEQVGIALRKAGIDPQESYSMERFEVVRHG